MMKGLLVVGFAFLALSGYADQLEIAYKPLPASPSFDVRSKEAGFARHKNGVPIYSAGLPAEPFIIVGVIRLPQSVRENPVKYRRALQEFAVNQGANALIDLGHPSHSRDWARDFDDAILLPPGSMAFPEWLRPGWLDDADYLAIRVGK
jgi:hypothetical protein